MWTKQVLWRVIAAGLIAWVGVVVLVFVAMEIGHGLFAESPVVTFVAYQRRGEDVYLLGVYDVRGEKLLRVPQAAAERAGFEEVARRPKVRCAACA